jgi:hypothetical protein
MEIKLNKYILAIITTNAEKVLGGSAPIFYCESEDEKEKVALNLTKFTNGMVHDLENGVYVVVRH